MSQDNGHWGIGLALALAANGFSLLLAFLVSLLSNGVPSIEWLTLVFLAAPGLTQLLGVVPLAIWQWSTGRKRTVWGLLIAAGIVLLLNSACWGMLAVGLMRTATLPPQPLSEPASVPAAPPP
ncbi:MAG: hypothetical protein Q8P41_15035 [Pseudomonadota bacterium]|nr:hypothetical protein [Pseudomonadota bacterium]